MKNALVVRLSSFGDILLTQPVLAGLAEAGYHVDLLVKPAYAELGALLPGVTRVVTDRGSLRPAYTLGLDLHGTWKSRMALAGTCLQRSMTYKKYSWARRMLIRPFGRQMFWNSWSHLRGAGSVVEWYRRAAERAGVKVAAFRPRVEVPASAQAEAVARLAVWGVTPGQGFALLAPGATHATKRWPAEWFGQLAARFEKELNLIVLITGSPDEADVCQEVAAVAGGRARPIAGATPPALLAALLERCALWAGNDSGPMHLAYACRARLLAFFGPTVPEFGFMPEAGPRVRILDRRLPCRPCSLHGGPRCPLGHHNCLRTISTEEAFTAAADLLKQDPEA